MQDAQVFATSFTVYTYDRRGRGDSGNTLPYSLEREIEDIEAMIDVAGGTAYVYGHSSGAVLALEAALRLGSKVQKVAMYDASYVHDEKEKAEYHKLSRIVQELLDDGNYAKAMRTFLKGIGMPRRFVWLLPLFPGWQKMKALAPTLAYDIALTQDLPPVERAAEVTVPVLIGVGEKSPTELHAVARQLAKAFPNAKYSQLTGQNHMVNAKKLLPLLSEFFR